VLSRAKASRQSTRATRVDGQAGALSARRPGNAWKVRIAETPRIIDHNSGLHRRRASPPPPLYIVVGTLARWITHPFSEIYQNFRSLVMAPIVNASVRALPWTRAILPPRWCWAHVCRSIYRASSSYTECTATVPLCCLSEKRAGVAQRSPVPGRQSGRSFPARFIGGRLYAVIALVRAAGLRPQAESGTYTLALY